MKRFCFWLAIPLLLWNSNVSSQTIKVSPEMWEACNLLTGKYKGGFFPEADVRRVVAELRAIRAVAPETAHIYARPNFELQTLLLSVRGMVPMSLSAHERVVRFGQLLSNPLVTGIPKFDDLNKKFGAVEITLRNLGDAGGGDDLKIQFGTPLDMGQVAAIYKEQLSGVIQPSFSYFQPNFYIGDGDRVERTANADGSLHYDFIVGSGDCPAGCMNRVYHSFDVFPEKGFRVVKVPKELKRQPPAERR